MYCVLYGILMALQFFYIIIYMQRLKNHLKEKKYHYFSFLLLLAAIVGVYSSILYSPTQSSAAPLTGADSDLSYYWATGFSGFTDDTTDANDADVAGDVALAGMGGGSYYQYFGLTSQTFDKIYGYVSSQALSSLAASWSYWNSGTWAALSVTNDTGAYVNGTGIHSFSFTPPENWAQVAVNGETPSYYVRMACNTGCQFGSVQIDQYSLHVVSSNTVPTATVPYPTQSAAGVVTVTSTIADADSNATSLVVEYSTDNSTWASSTLLTATENSEGDGVTVSGATAPDIDTDNDGSIALTFTWDIETDLPNTDDASVYVRIIPNDGTGDGSTQTSAAFAVDTKDPTDPGSLTVSATTTTSVTLTVGAATVDTNFADYKIYYWPYHSSGVTTSTVSSYTSTTDSNLGSISYGGATTVTITGLATSTRYVFNIAAYDSFEYSSLAATEVTLVTLAEPAGQSGVSTNSSTKLNLTIDAKENGTSTTFAIFNNTVGSWMSAAGASTASPVYQATTTWGAPVVLTDLTANTGYQFTVMSRNATSVTAASSTTSTIAYTDVALSSQNLVATSTATVTASAAQNNVVLNGAPGSGTAALTAVSIPSTVNDGVVVTLDFSRTKLVNVASTTSAVAITRQSLGSPTLELNIPAATTLTSSVSSWDGSFQAPLIKDSVSSLVGIPGAMGLAVEIGGSDFEIAFDNAVELIFEGYANNSAAYIVEGANPVIIDTVCDQDPNPTNIGAGQECKINRGGNLVIWTRHATTYFTFSAGGGSQANRGGGSVLSSQSSIIRIEGGKDTTKSREVTVVLDVAGAEEISLSNTPGFESASFVPYVQMTPWTLIEGNGTKIVYVRFRTKNGSTIDAKDTIELTGQPQTAEELVKQEVAQEEVAVEAVIPESETGCSLIENDAYRSKDGGPIWFVTAECTRQVFTSADRFFTYFDAWETVVTVDQDRLDAIDMDEVIIAPLGPKYNPKSGALFKFIKDPKIYLLLGANKHWIASESVFTALQYAWSWVEDVAQGVVDKFETGGDITDEMLHPIGSLIQYNGSLDVYRIEKDPADETHIIKRLIPNHDLPNSPYHDDYVFVLDESEQYDDGESVTSTVNEAAVTEQPSDPLVPTTTEVLEIE